MKKKISELELYQVDYFVALAENLQPIILENKKIIVNGQCINDCYSPTTNPSQAWNIIERNKIQITYDWYHKEWYCFIDEKSIIHHGKTSLESAMRCFVAIKFGEKVEI